MTDEELIAAFERSEEPDCGFHHAQHVRVAWCYIRAHPLPEALARFTNALRRFAAARGKPDLYHETITVPLQDRMALDHDPFWRPYDDDGLRRART